MSDEKLRVIAYSLDQAKLIGERLDAMDKNKSLSGKDLKIASFIHLRLVMYVDNANKFEKYIGQLDAIVNHNLNNVIDS